MSNALYCKAYGVWAGNPKGNRPDYTCCCQAVSKGRWSRGQCNRPRGHGPDKAYCKQHDPAKVAARRAASQARYDARWAVERIKYSGRLFYDALKKIADGHNDARGYAQEILDEFHNNG